MQITPTRNLICPLDGTALQFSDKQLTCANGHSFDIARQSYINLLPVQFKRSKNPGDSKVMVCARNQFLNRLYFSKIAQKLTEISLTHLSGRQDICLLDAGCGEGYFLDHIMRHFEQLDDSGQVSSVGLDISKWAIIAASKRNRHIVWVVGTNKRIPVSANTLDMIYCHFGFPNYNEFGKLLKLGGKIILTEAGPEHLIELRNIIYPQITTNHLKSRSEISQIPLLESHSLNYKITDLPQQDIANLLVMTPHLYRATQAGKAAAAKLKRMDLTIDITIRVLGQNTGETATG